MTSPVSSFSTIHEFLDRSAHAFPEKIAVQFEGKSYTYAEIAKQSQAVTDFVLSQTNSGDVVGILLQNTPEFIWSYFGVLRAGCAVLLLSVNTADTNLLFQVQTTRPRLIISTEQFRAKLERSGVLQNVTLIDAEKIPMVAKPLPARSVTQNAVCSVIFTSGTTAAPKGVKLRHRNVVQATQNCIEYLKWTADDIDVHILPLSHSFGLGNLHAIFAVGGTSILFRDSINLKKILETIVEQKATTFSAVPTTLRMILEHFPDALHACDTTLRFIQTNTSAIEKELITGILKTVPDVDFNYYYGLTEASRSTFITFSGAPEKHASVGQAAPNVEIRILDEKNQQVAAGTIGEICIRGRHVIDEYWKDPIASRRILDGWFHTGDAGYLDTEGYLYFVSRTDDVINSGGEKAAPEEIEAVVRTIKGVSDAAAVGIPDHLLGEVVMLYVVLSDPSLTIEDIKAICKSKLETYKVPRVITVTKSIPRTENGKIRRSELKKLN